MAGVNNAPWGLSKGYGMQYRCITVHAWQGIGWVLVETVSRPWCGHTQEDDAMREDLELDLQWQYTVPIRVEWGYQ